LNVGDSVIVKPGTKDPDTGGDIGGWQGRISELKEYDGELMVSLLWDSITLKNMPLSMIEQCEKDGLDWQTMGLRVDEVEPALARDTQRDITRAIQEIHKHTAWLHLGEEGNRIQKVLYRTDPGNTYMQLKAWGKHLEKILAFPFEAEIAEWQSGPFEGGERVIVQAIADLDEYYGIVVQVNYEMETFHLPLCDLEATYKHSANYQPVKDYAVWFANR
jgi:hypothetical protein